MANVYARSRKGATPFFRDERDNDRWAGVNISLPDFTLNISSVFLGGSNPSPPICL